MIQNQENPDSYCLRTPEVYVPKNYTLEEIIEMGSAYEEPAQKVSTHEEPPKKVVEPVPETSDKSVPVVGNVELPVIEEEDSRVEAVETL